MIRHDEEHSPCGGRFVDQRLDGLGVELDGFPHFLKDLMPLLPLRFLFLTVGVLVVWGDAW